MEANSIVTLSPNSHHDEHYQITSEFNPSKLRGTSTKNDNHQGNLVQSMKNLDKRWLSRNLSSFIWSSRVVTTSHILLTTSLSLYWISDHLITARGCGVLHENSYMYLNKKKQRYSSKFFFFTEMWPGTTIKTDEIIISSDDDRRRSVQRIANEQRCVTKDICSEWWDDGGVQHDNTYSSFFFCTEELSTTSTAFIKDDLTRRVSWRRDQWLEKCDVTHNDKESIHNAGSTSSCASEWRTRQNHEMEVWRIIWYVVYHDRRHEVCHEDVVFLGTEVTTRVWYFCFSDSDIKRFENVSI